MQIRPSREVLIALTASYSGERFDDGRPKVRIGEITVLPGDVILGTPTGVIAIPAHLALEVVETSEEVRVRDEFGKLRLGQGRYTSGEIDVPTWREDIEADFQAWRSSKQ